jgi:hypothetical protein
MSMNAYDRLKLSAIVESAAGGRPEDGDLMLMWLPDALCEAPFRLKVDSPEIASKILAAFEQYTAFDKLRRDDNPNLTYESDLFVFRDGDWTSWRDPETGKDFHDWEMNGWFTKIGEHAQTNMTIKI